MNKWWEYQKVLYPVTRRTDLGSEGEWRRGHFVASENAMLIRITITMPVATSVVANISMYDGWWYPNREAIVSMKIEWSERLILGKSQARWVPPCRITPTTIPPAISYTKTCACYQKVLVTSTILINPCGSSSHKQSHYWYFVTF